MHSLVNAFAYWQGTPAAQASDTYFDDMTAASKRTLDAAGNNAPNVKILNGETGWPIGKFNSSDSRSELLFLWTAADSL